MPLPVLFDSGIFSVMGLASELLVGAKLYWYAENTTTPLATYADSGLSVLNTNPVLANSAGRFPPIWLQSANYKMVLTTATGSPLSPLVSRQPISGITALDELAPPPGSDLIGFSHAETYAAATVGHALQAFVNVQNAPFNAKGDGSTDDTTALNAAATFARSIGARLYLPAVDTYYRVTGNVDFSDIANIDGRGARIYGTFSAIAAVTIGSAAIVEMGSIWLEVQNSADASTTNGTYGFKILGIRNTRCWLYARGFDEGLYFDGRSANTNFVGNEINVIQLYNNGSHVHIDMTGSSYFVGNHFYGGTWYLGTNQKKAGRGTVKLTLAGSSQAGQNIFHEPEIGIDGGSANTDHAMTVYASLNTSSTASAIFFKNARLETYSAFASDPFMVNIATNTSGRVSIDLDFVSASPLRWLMEIGASTNNSVTITNQAARSAGGNLQGQMVRPNGTFPYQTSDGIYIPGRILFNNDYTTPASVLTVGYSSRQARALGDGKIFASSGSVSYGLKYTKETGTPAFLRLSQRAVINVICYNSAGAVISGTAPWYAQMTQIRSATDAGATFYQGSTNWVWLHPDVASFYIGACPWTGANILPDIFFDVTFGDDFVPFTVGMTGPNLISSTATIQSYMPAGAAMDGTASNGWRNEFFLRTTTSAGAVITATAVTATSVTGVTAGDSIGIELDTAIVGSERQYFNTTVVSVVGSVINITDALPAAVASGRTILVNRWVAR